MTLTRVIVLKGKPDESDVLPNASADLAEDQAPSPWVVCSIFNFVTYFHDLSTEAWDILQ